MAAACEQGYSDHMAAESLGDLDGFKDVLFRRGQIAETEVTRRLASLSDLVTDDCLELINNWAVRRLSLYESSGQSAGDRE